MKQSQSNEAALSEKYASRRVIFGIAGHPLLDLQKIDTLVIISFANSGG
jgi:hypothetical protein